MIELPNTEYNKYLWDKYANGWDKLGVDVEDKNIGINEREKYLEYIGDEWGNKDSVAQVLNDFIFPYLRHDCKCGEIGSGGGRIASKVAPRVSELVCFDISEKMLQNAKEKLVEYSNIEYILTDGKGFSDDLKETFDFIYSFDVFVHLDLHTIWSYFIEIKKTLKKDGKAFIHTTNLSAPKGWERFINQREYSVEGHYFITPDMITLLAEKAGFNIIKTSVVNDTNFYYHRDFLFILENN
jgi:SAM-dependent methyltransferase